MHEYAFGKTEIDHIFDHFLYATPYHMLPPYPVVRII